MSKKPTVLMILDGYGLNKTVNGNAVVQARTPVMDELKKEYPFVKGNGSRTPRRADGQFRGRPSEYGSGTHCLSGIDQNHERD